MTDSSQPWPDLDRRNERLVDSQTTAVTPAPSACPASRPGPESPQAQDASTRAGGPPGQQHGRLRRRRGDSSTVSA